MHFDIHGYDTRSGETIDLYMPHIIRDNYKRSVGYIATNL